MDANESFVFEAVLSQTTANSDGWLGSSITADKNIVISNGGLNVGREPGKGSRDAAIDQPVPETQLGKEYVFVRANGTNVTETPIIIGIQDNTDIFVNGLGTPIATINNGEYFVIPSSNYSSTSAGANMLVTTSNDAYAYQCLAGASTNNTQGLNFVAPVNCLLPDVMDNIPDITNVAGTTLTGGVTIIASRTTPNANIIVTDGSGTVTLPAQVNVAGSSDWKTFYLPSLTGAVSVQSTGPIAVGFFGFNGVRGIAGYFSGFDTVPNVNLQIAGSGCLPGSDLEIIGSEVFDAYQWYRNGTIVPGATSSTYTPSTAGDYYLRVTKGACSYDSNPFAVYYCNPDIVLNKTVDFPVVNQGDIVTFTITAQSLGINPVTNLVITDNLPTGLDFISATVTNGSFSYPNWNLGTMNSGDFETMTITAKALLTNIYLTSETHTNLVTNSQDQTDSNTTTDNPSANVQVNFVRPKSVITNRRITVRVNKNK